MRAKKIYESLNFERGQNPKKSMKIGTEERILDWYREAYDEEPSSDLISVILEDDQLDDETKYSWAEFLVKDGYDWEADDYPNIIGNHFNPIDHVQPGWRSDIGDLQVRKTSTGFQVVFDEYTDWSDFIGEGNNQIYKQFIDALLAGDAFEYFYGNGEQDKDYIIRFIKEHKNELPAWEDVLSIYGYDGEVEEVINDIWENEDYEKLKTEIENAADDADSSAREGEARKDLFKELEKHYELGQVNFDHQKRIYIQEISKDGVNKLFDSFFTGDNKMDYFGRRDGYWAEWDPEYFDSTLYDKISRFL
jgi:hypothetical protein